MDPILKFVGQIAVLGLLVFIIVVGGGYHKKLQDYFRPESKETRMIRQMLEPLCYSVQGKNETEVKGCLEAMKAIARGEVSEMMEWCKRIEDKSKFQECRQMMPTVMLMINAMRLEAAGKK